jgi:hypothetical protein
MDHDQKRWVLVYMPCNLHTSTEKREARSEAEKFVGKAMKWTNLVSRSQIAEITMWPKDLAFLEL